MRVAGAGVMIVAACSLAAAGCSIQKIEPVSEPARLEAGSPAGVATPVPTASEAGILMARPARPARIGCPEPIHEPWCRLDTPIVVETVPDPIQRASPTYPDEAREKRVTGLVNVGALVCEHGRVVETRIVDSIPLLDSASQDAVEQWRFAPARREGRPVSCWVRASVRYSIH